MCFDPVSMAIAGAAIGAAGSIYAGEAANKQAQYGAAVSQRNAVGARLEGQNQAERIGEKYDRLEGTETSNAAASGVNPDAGSSALIRAETHRNRFLDTMSSLWNADTAAEGFEAQAAGQKMAGKNARTAGYIGAASSFLTGMGRARTLGRSSGTGGDIY